MSIGTSDGQYYDSLFDYHAQQLSPQNAQSPITRQNDKEDMHIDESTDVPLIAGALHNKDGFYGIAIDKDAAKGMTDEDKELLYHHEKAEQDATLNHGMPYNGKKPDGTEDKSNAAHDVVANAVEKGRAFEMALSQGKHPVQYWDEHQKRMAEALPISMGKYDDPNHELDIHPDLFREPYKLSGMTRLAGDVVSFPNATDKPSDQGRNMSKRMQDKLRSQDTPYPEFVAQSVKRNMEKEFPGFNKRMEDLDKHDAEHGIRRNSMGNIIEPKSDPYDEAVRKQRNDQLFKKLEETTRQAEEELGTRAFKKTGVEFKMNERPEEIAAKLEELRQQRRAESSTGLGIATEKPGGKVLQFPGLRNKEEDLPNE